MRFFCCGSENDVIAAGSGVVVRRNTVDMMIEVYSFHKDKIDFKKIDERIAMRGRTPLKFL